MGKTRKKKAVFQARASEASARTSTNSDTAAPMAPRMDTITPASEAAAMRFRKVESGEAAALTTAG